MIAYGHTGDLGRFFAVCPERKLVAIRLRQWKDSPDIERPELSFGGFLSMVEAIE